jgi:hypothetical protein
MVMEATPYDFMAPDEDVLDLVYGCLIQKMHESELRNGCLEL